MNTRLQAFLNREIESRHLACGLIAMAPNLLLYAWTGSLLWFHGALVTICLLIVQIKTPPSLSLLAIHAATMAILASLFYAAIPSVYLFAMVAAATGFMTFWITRLDGRLFSFGNWNFIPPLYLACEMSANATGPDHWTSLGQLLLTWPISIASVALVLRPPLFAKDGSNSRGWRHWFGLSSVDSVTVPSSRILRAASARATAILLATALMEWENATHEEWGIWSAASVVNIHTSEALEKFGHRAIGAIVGVGMGLLLGPLLPQSKALYITDVLGIFLTLIVIKRYPAAFTTRCFLVTMAAYAAALGMEAGRDRVINVVTGSLVGLVVMLIFKFVFAKLGLRQQAPPEPPAN